MKEEKKERKYTFCKLALVANTKEVLVNKVGKYTNILQFWNVVQCLEKNQKGSSQYPLF